MFNLRNINIISLYVIMNEETYYIHDNGGRPFKVDILDKKITDSFINYDIEDSYYIEFVTYYPKQIFIGKSPKNKMTEFSGGYGKKFDGNSILLRIKKNTYVYIGNIIYSFSSLNKIIKYESYVGNSDVTYPYAIDEKGYIYLFPYQIIIDPVNSNREKYEETKEFNVYNYYYTNNLMTQNLGCIPPVESSHNFENISKFYIGDCQYTLKYDSCPKKEYDRFLKDFKEDNVDRHGISIVHRDGKITQLTKEMYVNMMKKFGEFMGFQKLNVIMIHDRG